MGDTHAHNVLILGKKKVDFDKWPNIFSKTNYLKEMFASFTSTYMQISCSESQSSVDLTKYL